MPIFSISRRASVWFSAWKIEFGTWNISNEIPLIHIFAFFNQLTPVHSFFDHVTLMQSD